MKKIIYTQADGSVIVITPASKERVGAVLPAVLGMTDDEFLDWVKVRDVPQGAKNVQIVEESELPVDRKDRDKWRFVGGKVVVDSGGV